MKKLIFASIGALILFLYFKSPEKKMNQQRREAYQEKKYQHKKKISAQAIHIAKAKKQKKTLPSEQLKTRCAELHLDRQKDLKCYMLSSLQEKGLDDFLIQNKQLIKEVEDYSLDASYDAMAYFVSVLQPLTSEDTIYDTYQKNFRDKFPLIVFQHIAKVTDTGVKLKDINLYEIADSFDFVEK